MKKLQQGKELNLYECCSIYSMHTAIWMFGWTVSPEAAQQAFYMTQSPKDRTIINSYFKTPKETLRYKLAFPDNLKIESETYDDWFYDLLGNEIRSTQRFYYCSFLVTYSNVTYNANWVKIQGTLLKYIQDKGWIHPFNVTYTY